MSDFTVALMVVGILLAVGLVAVLLYYCCLFCLGMYGLYSMKDDAPDSDR